MYALEGIEMLDKRLTLALNSLHCGWSDQIWTILSSRAIWIPDYLLVAAGFIRHFGWKRALLFIGGAGLLVLFSDQFCNLVKDTFCRIRPCNDAWMIDHGLNCLSRPTRSFGFFSAHAANSFGLATYAVKGINTGIYGKRNKTGTIASALIFLWATAVSASRIFVGRHFLGDIIVGLLFGILAGYVIALAVAFVNRRIKAKG